MQPDAQLTLDTGSWPQDVIGPGSLVARAAGGYALLVSSGDRYELVQITDGAIAERTELDPAQGIQVAPMLAAGELVAAVYRMADRGAAETSAQPFLALFDGGERAERRPLEVGLEPRAVASVRPGVLAVVSQRAPSFGLRRGPLVVRVLATPTSLD